MWGTGACGMEVGGAGTLPLMDRATSGGVFWGVCEFGMTLGSLSADSWGCVPVVLVVQCEVSSTIP